MPAPRELSLQKLKLVERNPRMITPARLEQLKRALEADREMLSARPVIALPDGTVVAGNMRVRAALELGWKTIPTVTVDLDAERARLWMLRDNQGYGEWDEPLLAELLAELSAEGADLDLAGFGERELVAFMASVGVNAPLDEDEAPPPPRTAKSKAGQIYELGPHRLLCGDAADLDAVLELTRGASVSAVLTDPPYGVSYEAAGRTMVNDDLRDDAFEELLRTSLDAAYQATIEGGAIYVWHSDGQGLAFRRAMQDAGWLLKQTLVWVKNHFVLGRQDYQWQHEPVLYGWKPGAAHRWYGERVETTVFDDDVDLGALDKTELVRLVNQYRTAANTTVLREEKPVSADLHPTMKPVTLLSHLIRNSTTRGERVLDAFAGSGSTLIAAEQTGREARLVEIDPTYCDVIRQRYADYTNQPNLAP